MGLAWFGLPWFGLVWLGLAWLGLASLFEQNPEIQKNIENKKLKKQNPEAVQIPSEAFRIEKAERIKKKWLGLVWLGLAWLGLAWFGLAWLGFSNRTQKLKTNQNPEALRIEPRSFSNTFRSFSNRKGGAY